MFKGLKDKREAENWFEVGNHAFEAKGYAEALISGSSVLH